MFPQNKQLKKMKWFLFHCGPPSFLLSTWHMAQGQFLSTLKNSFLEKSNKHTFPCSPLDYSRGLFSRPEQPRWQGASLFLSHDQSQWALFSSWVLPARRKSGTCAWGQNCFTIFSCVKWHDSRLTCSRPVVLKLQCVKTWKSC